ncbi:hypothetical protein ACFPPA_13405 [Rhodanobacter ginsengisoli]|uniref:Uncharacterized protein n=1 Tax=Rhodanobacter ginsengisoli TaxID=418646 RepID=A0ABW0QR94_9GAMM
MLAVEDSNFTKSFATSWFMLATAFISLWPLTNVAFLFASALFAASGSVALYGQFRRTPGAHRARSMAGGVLAALIFVVFAQIQIGYHVGKYMALQDNGACRVQVQGTPDISTQLTRCTRR